jgi:lipopolysaccharide transport system permease protein
LLIVAHPNYVKKMVFPVELLPAARVATATFFSLISLALLLLCQALVWRHVYIQWLLAPVLYAPLLLLCLGVGWFLAALGVYVRDVAHLSGLLASILLFLTPVFYPLTAAPAQVRWLLLCNPLTVIVDSFRQTLVTGAWPDWRAWALCLAGCFVICQLGYLWFALTRRGFADVV